jgi:RNA polymerase sigma factor (sigma-70 family)
MGSKIPSTGLDLYAKRIKDYPILTPEEELRLAHAYKNGDIEAGQKVVTSNLRFVIKISQSYLNLGFPPFEIIQEGNMGLVKSLQHFDPERGIRFISYAIWWIKAYIKNFMLKNYKPHVGRLSHAKGLISLDSKFTRGDDQEDGTMLDHMLDDTPNQEDHYGMKEQSSFLATFLNSQPAMLSDRDFYVIQQRFFCDPPATLKEIAGEIGVTRERVRQIEVRSLKRLRAAIEKQCAMIPSDIELGKNRIYSKSAQKI